MGRCEGRIELRAVKSKEKMSQNLDLDQIGKDNRFQT